jgi:hypothetical protein
MKKILLIAGGIILAIILALFALVYLKGDQLATLAIEKSIPYVESALLKNLPADVSADDVKATFVKVADKIKSKQYDTAEAQNLLLIFKKSMDDKKVDADEVKKMLESAKKIAGE